MDEVVACSVEKDGPLIYARVLLSLDDDNSSLSSSNGAAGTATAAEEVDMNKTYVKKNTIKRVRLSVGSGFIEKLSSEVYSFKAARERMSNNSNNNNNNDNREENNDLKIIRVPILNRNDLNSVEPLTADNGDGGGLESVSNSSSSLPVEETDILKGVEDILAKVDLSLKSDQKTLMADTLKLRTKLNATSHDLEISRMKVAELTEDFARIPDEFRCSITREIMSDPVICSDGHTYERAAIERWLSNHRNSPKTNAPLPSRNVLPNHNLRTIIEAFKERRGI